MGSIRIRLNYSNFEIRIIAKNIRILNFEFESNLSSIAEGEVWPSYTILRTTVHSLDNVLFF
jgi:hypothetical protein